MFGLKLLLVNLHPLSHGTVTLHLWNEHVGMMPVMTMTPTTVGAADGDFAAHR